MNEWQKRAHEQAKHGNVAIDTPVDSAPQQLKFQSRRNYVPGEAIDKGRGLPEYGHMIFLKKLNQDNQEIILITSLGYVVRGFLKAVDEQTLSLKCPNKGNESSSEEGAGYRTRILFKSQIIEISPVRGIENLADELEEKGWVNPETFSGFVVNNTSVC